LSDPGTVTRSGNWHWLGLLVVLCIAAWVQVTAIRETRLLNAGGPDAAAYVSYAYNLREFGVYSRTRTWDGRGNVPIPDSVSTPGYPLFLSAFLRDVPDQGFMDRVVVAQAALGTATALLSFLLCLRVCGPLAATVGGVLVAITPHLATISTNLLTEPLYTVLLVAWLLATVHAIRSRNPWTWAFSGALFGLACLVRPTLQPLLPIAALSLLAIPVLRARWREGLAAVLVACALLAPWLAYKHSHPAQPDLLRATLYHGSFPGFMFEDDPRTLGMAYRFDPEASRAMASNEGLLEVVGSRMRAQPLRYAGWYLVGKPIYFLAWDNSAGGTSDAFIYPATASPFRDRPAFRAMHAGMWILHWPLMLLAVATAVIAWLRPAALTGIGDLAALRFLATIALGAIALHMIGAPYPRYGIPFQPLLYVLALSGLMGLMRGAGSRGQT